MMMMMTTTPPPTKTGNEHKYVPSHAYSIPNRLTSSWNPLNELILFGCGRVNVPYGEVVNSTNSSGPLDIDGGNGCPPPQNFRMIGSRVVYPSYTVT